MKNRDYLILALGGLVISFAYVFEFKDAILGIFMKGIGFCLTAVFIIKGIDLLIKRENETT